MQMFRKPIFWIVFLVISIACAVGAYIYFPKAFSIVNVSITMDRSQAEKKAKEIAAKYNLSVPNSHVAAMFTSDGLVQYFVELEAGGKEAFIAMIEKDLYQAYQWNIRLFKESKKEEVTIKFTPQGKPYGFVQTLSENTPGADLTTEQALEIAQSSASTWEGGVVDLTHYMLVESSKEVHISGRADHTFVYEREDVKLGEGLYRVKLIVSGDKLTMIQPFVKVPEAFMRRYAQMRTTNLNIAQAASIAMYFLYFFIGCLASLFFLFRQRYVLWGAPLFWGFVFGAIIILTTFNQLPLLWMSYDTALSKTAFLLQIFMNMIMSAITSCILMSIIFMAAESLSRKAFKYHTQLWRSWDLSFASTYTILGQTLGGYLFVPIFLMGTILFYWFTQMYLGWWTPASQLFNPNILATYVPWFNAVANAFRAGFWEECMFRAVPLAGAALIGERYGKKKWWIAGAFILQAVIFAGGHANYPAQPAYARLVELLIPSTYFGFIYLLFGLLPGIIMHFIYDAVLYLIPLFVATGTSAFINQIIAVIVCAIPLLIVLYARIKKGHWHQFPSDGLNDAWQPAPEKKQIIINQQESVKKCLSPRYLNAFLLAGCIALVGWIFLIRQVSNDTTPLTLSRKKSREVAQQHFNLQKPWMSLSTVRGSFNRPDISMQQKFIWQKGGEQTFKKMLGDYVPTNYWQVRFAKFQGDIVDRAEEFSAFINQKGNVFRTIHQLPESRNGSSITKEQARTLARTQLQKQFNIDPAKVIEISAVEQKKPHRKDWIFTFNNPQVYTLKEGQARINVTIGGDKVIDAHKYIHVPEQWQREEQNRQSLASVVVSLCTLLLYLLFIGGSIFALTQWSAGLHIGFSTLLFSLLFFVLYLILLVNSYPKIIIDLLNTSQPFNDQVVRFYGTQVFLLLIKSLTLALVISFINQYKTMKHMARSAQLALAGFSSGIVIAQVLLMVRALVPKIKPTVGDFSALGTYVPLLAGVMNYVLLFVSLTILFYLLFIILDSITNHWQINKWHAFALCLLFGLLMAGMQFADNYILYVAYGIVLGLLLCIIQQLLVHFDPAIIPMIMFGYMSMYVLVAAKIEPHPWTFPIALVSMMCMGVIAWFWFKRLNK